MITQTFAPESSDLATILVRYTDVTERLKRSHEALGREVVRLREELEEKNKELQRRERLSALGVMAAGLAHEIRNPLGGMRLYACLLERDLADRPKQQELVRRMERGIRSLDGLVTDVLAFSSDAEPVVQTVCVGDILDEVVSNTAPQAEAKRVRIDVDEALQDAFVACDAAQVGRALLNLVLNALDAVPEGGAIRISERGTVAANSSRGDRNMKSRSLECRTLSDTTCHICVEDSGPGIPAENLQRVFHPFFTTKHSGTGLGLAIVHRIAEANGGFVRAGNRPGGGAVFTLSFPRAAEGVAAVHATEGAE